jgi:aminoglycoside phosphotransferase (APT) family kinase protein
MNAILSRLDALRDRRDVDRLELDENTLSVILTPRFRTSRHIVALLIPDGAGEPRFVVKMPRLAGDGGGIAREARVLKALQESAPQVAGSIPEVVGWADGDRPLLIETALVGSPMTRAMVRTSPSRYIDEVVRWLIGLPREDHGETASFERLIEGPLERFAESFPKPAVERDLVARTFEVVEPLRGAPWPRVFEHGDLSHPNLIWLPDDRIGVVDWELAEEEGFPLHDLSFFLAFATSALRRARSPKEFVVALDDAFFSRGGWAWSRANAYADGFGLDEALLSPLFVACWARYTAGLTVRIAGDRSGLDDEAAAWVRENRYYRLWVHTLENLSRLGWRR